MADFKKTVIVNEASDISGTAASLKIDGFGEFKKEDIVDVTYCAAVEEVKYKAVFTLPAGVAGKNYRLDLVLGVDHHHPSHMANPLVTEKFDFNYECKGDTATNMAAKIVKAYDEETSIKQRCDFTMTQSAGTITIECKDAHYKLRSIKYGELTNDDITGYDNFSEITLSPTITNNVMAFGDELWMQERIQFPNHNNRRMYATRGKNKIKPDTMYSQFVIKLKQPRGITGNALFGQYIESMSEHIIYASGDLTTGVVKAIMDKLELLVDDYYKVNQNPTESNPMLEKITFDGNTVTTGV